MTQPQAQTAGAGAESGGQGARPRATTSGRAIPKVSGDRVAQLGPLIALLLACIFFTTQSDQFLDPANFSLIIQQVMVVGTLAIGQTLIILTAGIDLSCGTAMALGSIVMTKLAVDSNVPPLLAILLGVATCAAIGFVNGGLVVGLALPPFIVTLGTFSICLALTHIYSKDETISSLPSAMTKLGESFKIGDTAVTYGSLVTLALFAFIWFVLTQTTWGRRVYALGDNPEATRLMGIPVRKQLLMVYVVAGIIYGIAALLLVARTGVGDPNAGHDRQPRRDHRGGARRHEPVRRPRHDHRHPDRGADHRRGAQRPRPHGRGVAVPDPDHRHPGHRRRVRRPDREEARMSTTTETRTPILSARGIHKRYGNVTAIDGADFDLYPGEILAVIGDNGAGKSSLIKVLSGATIPDSGTVSLDGEEVSFKSPLEARRAGIETVYQDLAVAPALDIATNLFLGREKKRDGPLGSVFRMLDHKGMKEEADKQMKALQIGIRSMSQAVETLSGGQRQGVAVARAAAWARKLVIMDEPTAALGVKESGQVLELIKRVRDNGLPVILISHNMPHVFEIADRIHIHRLGKRVAVVDPKETSMHDVVGIMTGAVVHDIEHQELETGEHEAAAGEPAEKPAE